MWREVDQRIRRALSSVRQAFRGVGAAFKNGGVVVMVQAEGLADEKLLDAELFQHFGFTSMPPQGSMLVSLPVGGKTSHSIVVATEHGNYRLKILKSGEAALYSQEGAYVAVRQGKVVEVNCDTLVISATNKVQINSPQVLTTGLIKADQDITDKAGSGGKSMASMRVNYNDHDHNETGRVTNKTNQPI